MAPSYLQSAKHFIENVSANDNVVIFASSIIGEEPIKETDFIECNDMFIAVYGEQYADDGTAQYARVNLLFELMKRKGYSRLDMQRALFDFFESKQSVYGDTWKPADILAAHPPHELLTFVKYCQLTTTERKYFVAYNTERGVLFGDVRFIGDKLERVQYVPDAKALPEHKEQLPKETLEEVSWCMRALKAEDKLSAARSDYERASEVARKAVQEADEMRAELDSAREEIDALKLSLEIARKQIIDDQKHPF